MTPLKYFLLSTFALNVFLLQPCCSKKVAGLQAFPPMEQQGYIRATVKNYTVDGCTWLLILEDGKKLQPVVLDAKFQKDKLPVWIRYEAKKAAISICMTGEIVNITAIELR